MTDNDTAGRYRNNLQGEVDGASLYRALAEAEKDPNLSEVYRRLSAVEDAHAEFWRKQLGRIGSHVGQVRPGWRSRALAWLARRLGPQFVLPTITSLEKRDSRIYDSQPEARAKGLPEAERSHNRIIQAVVESLPRGLTGGELARLEGRHRMGGNALRAAVLGANDGLVSNLSLVMGVAGAAASSRSILLTGLAGLVAGACSMAMGEWLSVTSARELSQRQIDIEADELARVPEEEKEEMILIYQAKGLSPAEARELAERLMANKESALDTLVREELGIDPSELGGSPWVAATASFCLFALGAIFPVLPYFWLAGRPALLASLLAGGLALAVIGAGTSLFTGRRLSISALRQLLIGFAAAGVTYAIGHLVGASIGG
jgi:VIT1/CCC1 family predicted Fe2+/Mn2+ transporter